MPEILTERFENILRIQFNRPEKKNAMTMNMYSTVAALLNAAAKDDETRLVLLHGAGDARRAAEAGARHARRGRGGPHGNGSGDGTQTDTTAGRGRAREQAPDEACLGRSNGGRCRTRDPGVRRAFAVG